MIILAMAYIMMVGAILSMLHNTKFGNINDQDHFLKSKTITAQLTLTLFWCGFGLFLLAIIMEVLI